MVTYVYILFGIYTFIEKMSWFTTGNKLTIPLHYTTPDYEEDVKLCLDFETAAAANKQYEYHAMCT